MKDHYYKVMIKSKKKVSQIKIVEIKRAIQRVLIDLPITDIQGGEANNNGYYKFKTEGDKVGNSS